MYKVAVLLLGAILFVQTNIYAQTDSNKHDDINIDDLVADDSKSQKIFANNAFKSTRVINGHSMEMLGAGILDTRILHRFGIVSNGAKDLFGLDNASMRMGLDYGISKNFTVGIGRSTFNKEIDGYAKYRIAHQHTNIKPIPVSILYIAGITCKTIPYTGADSTNFFSNRLGFYHQLIIGRKFSNNFSLQLSPTFVHRNLVDLVADYNDMLAIGIGTRYKISQRTALVIDAFPIIYGARANYTIMPLSIGVDIETGGHVFQLHFSNAKGMNERAFITETTQRWDKSQFQFGFNLSRVFTVKKNTAGSW